MKSEELTTVKAKQKEFYGSSFLWPLMLLANNIGQIFGIFNVPGQAAYWFGLGIFITIGIVGIVVSFMIRLCRKPKCDSTGKSLSKEDINKTRRARIKKYTFWRHFFKDALALLSGALYLGGDNLTLLLEEGSNIDPDQTVRSSFLSSYLVSGSLLVIGLSYGFMLVMDPLCGLKPDKKILEMYKKKVKVNWKTSTTPVSTVVREEVDTNIVPDESDKNEQLDSTITASSTTNVHKNEQLDTENADDDDDDSHGLPDLAYWQMFVQRLSMFLVVAAIADQFYVAIIDEIIRRDMNFTSGVACVPSNRSAGVAFYTILAVFGALGVATTSFVYLVRWRKHIKIRSCTSYCGAFETVVVVVLTIITFLYIPVYIAADNTWPWICFANEYGTLEDYESIRSFLLCVIFVMTVILLFMEVVLVSWPRRLLSYKENVTEDSEWYEGIRLRYLRKAMPEIIKTVKDFYSKSSNSVKGKNTNQLSTLSPNDKDESTDGKSPQNQEILI